MFRGDGIIVKNYDKIALFVFLHIKYPAAIENGLNKYTLANHVIGCSKVLISSLIF